MRNQKSLPNLFTKPVLKRHQLKPLKLTSLVLLLSLFYLGSFGSQSIYSEQREEKNVFFRWAFGAMVGPENDQRLVAITRDTELKTGDRLKMLIEMKKKCFIYLVYCTGQNEIYMLFPYDLQQFTADYETFKKYYIPRGENWFELDENIGLESFYLLASDQRLDKLERLLTKYRLADPGKKNELAGQILTEIRKIKRRQKKLTITAERVIPIGGSMRGTNKDKRARHPDIDPIAADVLATNFYGRTFTIDHQ